MLQICIFALAIKEEKILILIFLKIKSTAIDCNNSLTDDEFGAMFAATGKEMLEIKQPMECPIERTQYKCKKCASEAKRKHHHNFLHQKGEMPPLW